MTETLKYLTSSRKYLRSSVTRIFNSQHEFDRHSEVERNALILKLNNLSEDLMIYDKKINSLKFQDDAEEGAVSAEMSTCEEYIDKIHTCLSLLSLTNSPLRRDSTNNSNSNHLRTLLKSPTAPLPEFHSAEGENLSTFIENFEETLGKYKYTSYDKFLLLTEQVHGKASLLLDSLEPNKRTYDEAKSLLIHAFASSGLQKYNTLKLMSEIKLTYSTEPFLYMSQMRKIKQSFDTLGISVDDVMQYFFFRGLNDSFRSHLIQITNDLRPNLDSLFDNFFSANERYAISQKLFKSKSDKKFSPSPMKTSAFAVAPQTNNSDSVNSVVNVDNPFNSCTLCDVGKASDHPINKCVYYSGPSDKIKRLKDLNGCLKCASISHNTSRCKFRFRKPCNKCSKWHFTFLCLEKVTNAGENKFPRDTVRNTGNSVTVGPTCVSHQYSSVALDTMTVLSTFSFCLSNGSTFRGLRDSGCQNNLISESCLTNVTFKVLQDNIELNVRGINSSKLYNSKLISIDIFLNNSRKTINALVIPSINIKLNLPGLKRVANEIEAAGYELADKLLSSDGDLIENLGLILGAESAHIFCGEYVPFGKEGCCVYLQTDLGILLEGNLSKISENLKFLLSKDNHLKKQTYGYDTATCAINYICNLSSQDCQIYDDHFNESTVNAALEEDLERQCNYNLFKKLDPVEDNFSELNKELLQYLLSKTTRLQDGRLVMPLLWNKNVENSLSTNYELAKNVLFSSRKKLLKNKDHLALVEKAVAELEEIGAVEKIHNLEEFKALHPAHSFLAHMPVLRMDKESTKCRIVYLSNLNDKSKDTLSHNQCMYSGPCLNQKLTTALLLLRFGKNLLCFDLKKAFLQIQLRESDQARLLFLWFKNISKKDFSLQVYKNIRLSFGLRCSPTILMMAMYKILILDTENDCVRLKSLKRDIYSLIYMDNGSVTTDDVEDLDWAYHNLGSIFSPYRFDLQQYFTNCASLQKTLKQTAEECPLFGLIWNTTADTLTTKKKILNEEANTKRKILKSIAENFDPFQFDAPIMNRSRLFMSELQLDKKLGWDTDLAKDKSSEWKCIARQVNNSTPLVVSRFVGKKTDLYRLIAFCDSSKLIYGTVVYIQSLMSKKVNLVMTKNHLCTTNLKRKSIPSLELLSILLGVETLANLNTELSTPLCLSPIVISELVLYSDSLVALAWVKNYCINLDKMNKANVFVLNRLEKIRLLCDKHTIKFMFVEGFSNPADCATRPLSSKVLARSNYLSGPDFLTDENLLVSKPDTLKFTVPRTFQNGSSVNVGTCSVGINEYLIDPEKYSRFRPLLKIYIFVNKFIRNCKRKIGLSTNVVESDSLNCLLRAEQKREFPDILNYFNNPNLNLKNIPNLVTQLNLFLDSNDIIRVGSKLYRNSKFYSNVRTPILLSKRSHVTKLVIRDTHEKLFHSGMYSVLNELRKNFWIPHFFATVKKVLRNCVHCKRFNQRTVKLNQNSYRQFRDDPLQIPFSSVFVDYIGPFAVRGSHNNKAYVLCVTCLYSRAINLKVCVDLSTREFLRAFQMHSFEYGIPQFVYSDMGTQLVAGGNLIEDFFNDHEIHKYFKENNAEVTKFTQFFKGNSALGSLVESCVKITKRLLFGSIKRNCLQLREFEFFVANAAHYANRRPIGFKDHLRAQSNDSFPGAITPELILHGRHLLSVNSIPYLQTYKEQWSPDTNDPIDLVRKMYDRSRKVRDNLKDLYHKEFLSTLISQATNLKDRYQPVKHKSLAVGDLVLIKEDNHKPSNYPMAKIKSLQVNSLGEVTGAELVKGSSNDIIKRHSSRLIPLLQNLDGDVDNISDNLQISPTRRSLPKRRAAVKGAAKTRKYLHNSEDL